MNKVPTSSYSLFALGIGVVLSVATTCGPPDPVPWESWDTGSRWDTGGGGGGTTWDPGYTVDDSVALRLDGIGDSAVHTVRVNLTEDCLAEVSGSDWGPPVGWTVIGVVLAVAEGTDTDTGGAGDTASDTAADTGGDTATSAADAKFHVTVSRSDGLTVLDDTFGVYDALDTRALASDLAAFTSCAREAACETTWRVEVTHTEGSPLEGDLNVHSRIQLCSSGEGEERHISVAIE